MKKTILSAAAVMIMLFTAVTGYAFGDVEFLSVKTLDYDGFYSVITDTEGAEHRLFGVIDADSLEKSTAFLKIGSYKIYFGDEEVIEVRLNNIKQNENKSENQPPLLTSSDASPLTTDYYTVEFKLNDTTDRAFITGLTENNVENVQNEILKAKLEKKEFELSDTDFIDTEKTGIKDKDSLMCWAASTSNMLEYSGWARKATMDNTGLKLKDEDDIFDLFVQNFTDKGGNQYYGLQWFFNGYYTVQNIGSGWSTVKEYESTGKYLKDYAYSDVTSSVSMEKHENISEILSALKSGSAVGVSISWIDNNNTRNGGHAITMWGYVYDTALSENDKGYMKSLIISDSDSHKTGDSDRRTAENRYKELKMSPYAETVNTSKYDTWKLDNYSSGGDVGVLEGFTLLKPYNKNVRYEKDTEATRDMINNCDFYISSVSVNNSDEKRVTVGEAENLAIIPTINNGAGCVYTGGLSYSVKAVNKSTGEVEEQASNSITVTDSKYSYSYYYLSLSEGEYTVTVTLNPEKTIPEAYYYNNTYSFDLTVSEPPLELTDNDGKINNNIFSDSITIKNASTVESVFTPILALYTNDGRLIGIKALDETTLSAGDEEIYNFEITCGGKIPNDARHKIYLWKSGMVPVEYKIINKTE